MVQVSHKTTSRNRSFPNRRHHNLSPPMTQQSSRTTRSRTPIPHSTQGLTENSLDGIESQGDILNDGNWEWTDSEEPEVQRLPERGNSRPATTENHSANYRISPRKRGIRRTHQLANLPRKQGIVPPSPKPPQRSPSHETSNEIRDAALGAIAESGKHTARYLLSVLKIVGHLARWPIAFGITSFLLMVIMGFVSTSIRRAFEPLCIIPGISLLSVCNPGLRPLSPESVADTTPKWADYSKLMDVETKSFEQLLGDTVGGSALALELKKAEMATKDLIVRVRISDLKAKDTLAVSLMEFVQDAREAGRSLQKLSSKVGGSVDSIMAVNDYALHSISSARENVPSPWSPRRIWTAPSEAVDKVVMESFETAMNVLSVNMERLIVEAEHNLYTLNKLEERLATLHELVAREDSSVLSAKEDLLEDLWTKLGGNRKFLKNYEYHLLLLRGLGRYRKEALAHVAGALQTLRAMSADMEDMRERVAAPELMGPAVPVEVHMKSIQMGLERLREGRIQAEKLEKDAVRKIISHGEIDLLD